MVLGVAAEDDVLKGLEYRHVLWDYRRTAVACRVGTVLRDLEARHAVGTDSIDLYHSDCAVAAGDAVDGDYGDAHQSWVFQHFPNYPVYPDVIYHRELI